MIKGDFMKIKEGNKYIGKSGVHEGIVIKILSTDSKYNLGSKNRCWCKAISIPNNSSARVRDSREGVADIELIEEKFKPYKNKVKRL